MNPREKVLAMCVAGVLVLGGLWVVVNWGVVQRWQNLNDDVAKLAQEEQELHRRLAKASIAEDRWSALKPLAHNPDVAEQRFYRDINTLLARHGLMTTSANSTTKTQPVAASKKNPFAQVKAVVNTEGTLNQVLGFLCDLYRREYLLRVDNIRLNVQQTGRRSFTARRGRRGRSASRREEPTVSSEDGPKLKVSLTAMALVLPEITNGPPQSAIERVEPPPESLGRLPRDPTEYELVLTDNLFKEWQPKPTQVVTGPPDPPGPTGVKDPVKPPQPPSSKVLTATMCTFGKLEVLVRDEERLELPPERLGVNDPVDDGTLVLVYPGGMVVQVLSDEGEEFEYTYYVYERGRSFSEREELDPVRYPELQRQLEEDLVP